MATILGGERDGIQAFEAQLLDRVFKHLSVLEGLKFEFQGTVGVDRLSDSVSFSISPLERISLQYHGSSWRVRFEVNDADDRGASWQMSGAYGHVIHALRGYVLGKCGKVANLSQIQSVIDLD